MANYLEVSDETKKLFTDVVDKTSIPKFVEFELLCNNKQKDIYKIMKLNDLIETLTEGINFVIIINEEIFEQLTEDQQKIALDECLAGISVNDNDVISQEKPDFSTYTGVLQKYGHEDIIVLHESIKSLYDAKKQKEAEEKAAKAGKRGRRPKSE